MKESEIKEKMLSTLRESDLVHEKFIRSLGFDDLCTAYEIMHETTDVFVNYDIGLASTAIAGEFGEFCEVIVSPDYTNKYIRLIKEAGDLMWYSCSVVKNVYTQNYSIIKFIERLKTPREMPNSHLDAVAKVLSFNEAAKKYLRYDGTVSQDDLVESLVNSMRTVITMIIAAFGVGESTTDIITDIIAENIVKCMLRFKKGMIGGKGGNRERT